MMRDSVLQGLESFADACIDDVEIYRYSRYTRRYRNYLCTTFDAS